MTGGVALIVVCELVEVECSVPVREIRTVTTDHQTKHNDNYVNYSTLHLLNTITKKCNFFSFIKHNTDTFTHTQQKTTITLHTQVNSKAKKESFWL